MFHNIPINVLFTSHLYGLPFLMLHCPAHNLVRRYENAHNGLIVNRIYFFRSPSQTRSLLRPGSVVVRLQLPLKTVARGRKSLNDNHKNVVMVDVTKRFQRNADFLKKAQSVATRKWKEYQDMFEAIPALAVLLANATMLISNLDIFAQVMKQWKLRHGKFNQGLPP